MPNMPEIVLLGEELCREHSQPFTGIINALPVNTPASQKPATSH